MLTMDQLTTFVSNNPYLFLALLVILVLLSHNFFGGLLHGIKSVTPSEATLLINRENALVLDVREGNETYSGYILNSIHIPHGNMKDRMGELEKHKSRPIIVTGNRALPACNVLKKQGFANISKLTGGINAWQNANLPLSKK